MAEKKDEALVWAEGQVATFADRRPDYVTFADTLEQVLKGVAKVYCPLAIVQARPKGIASFADKALRKRSEHPDPVNQFTDLCGARLIAQTGDQVDAVSDFLKAHFTIDWENSVDTIQRLRAAEFGYRSVHYIVTFRPDVFPTADVLVEVPSSLFKMPNPRAEVQVRTVLEHAYADISHDLLYKTGFRAPRAWERKFGRLAAVLEDADADIADLHDEIQVYASSYAAMTPSEMRTRLTQCLFVLSKDTSDLAVVREIATLCLLLADWDTAVEALRPYVEKGDVAILRDYGLAFCGRHADDRHGPDYKRGLEIIQRACDLPTADVDAWLALAESAVGGTPKVVREHYRKAFHADPTNERALEKYLDVEIGQTRSLEIVDIVRPLVQSALERCHRRIEIGVDLVAAYLTTGKFLLLLGDPYRSLAAYAKGAQVASAPHQLDEALLSLESLEDVADRLEGYEWARRVLLLRLATWREVDAPPATGRKRGPGAVSAKQAAAARRARRALVARHLKTLTGLATPAVEPLPKPVVVVAGGCDPSLTKQMRAYRTLIVDGFGGFCGTVVGPGTKEGIGGLVGEMARRYSDSVVAVTYEPNELPRDATSDPRYGVRHLTPGHSFSPLQPLQTWTDLVVSGVDPADVRLLGINGGPIAAAEYRIALALGATVALVEESGREAARVVPDEDWGDSARLLRIPADPATVREFVTMATQCEKLDEERREVLGREVHEEYRRNRQLSLRSNEPTMRSWSRLPKSFQESNRAQADSIPRKLEKIDCTAVAVEGRAVRLVKLTVDEVNRLAEIEHARWVIERLQDGWRLGPRRDVDRKTSPYLVPWAELSDEVREWDRQTVRKIPEFLATVGLEVRRKRGARSAPTTAARGQRPRT